MFYSSNYLCSRIEFYYEASFIKILNIILMNTMFLNGCMYQFKPWNYNPWALLLCMLICNPLVISCSQLRMALNKFRSPVRPKIAVES
jgi:hypothetical protein